MLSFWERNSFTSYDYVIIGGGIVGLSTAISLKEQQKNASVLVLERGIFPSGASTKNAGFACFGSLTEILSDINNIGEGAAVELVSERWRGLKQLRKRLGDKNLDFKNYGGFELITENEKEALESIDRVNELLYPLFNQQVYTINSKYIKQFGFNRGYVKEMVHNPLEGQVDTGLMMKNLIALALSLGVVIYTGVDVNDFEEKENSVSIRFTNPISRDQEVISLEAKKVAVCTNAFTKKIIPHLEINPGRGLVLVTAPLSSVPFKGTFHMEEGFYYFRNFKDRVIFGGGRNLDLLTENSTKFEINKKIYAALQDKLTNIIIPGVDYKVDITWVGIMAFGESKQAVVQQISERVAVGVRLGGMGVAIGTQVGDRLSQLLLV